MEAVAAGLISAPGGGGGAGPAPFLLKTYEMVDDSTTDDIVSWSPTRKSFIVWNPPEFGRILLPTYFKHNNFSSFIRQLNTYGFRKIDPERWEFANEDFVKDQKHLLKNIHRRKPIHSHSNPQGTAVDPERTAFEEEIDKLSHEKTVLEGNVLRFKQQQSTAKVQLEDLTQRLSGIEKRQDNLLTFLDYAVKRPSFIEALSLKLESMDVSAYNKKRRLPQVDQAQYAQENMMVDDHSSSKPEFGNNSIPQDFCNKLTLELSPAVSDINLLSHSTQSSNEDGEISPKRISERWPKDVQKCGDALYAPETLDLSDTGTSFGSRMESPLPQKAADAESPQLHSFQPCLTSTEDGDGHVSCHLNLSLASSALPIGRSQSSAKVDHVVEETGKSAEAKLNADGNEADLSTPVESRKHPDGDTTLSSSHNDKQGPATQARVNDVFWEQFLTEKPGSMDNEEASSNYRASPYDEQEHKKLGRRLPRNIKNAEHLSL